MVDQSLALVGHWLAWLLALVVGLFAVIEAAMRQLMDQLRIAPGLQTIVLVLLTVVLIIGAVRVFGGVVRLLLILFLVLLLTHIVMHHGSV